MGRWRADVNVAVAIDLAKKSGIMYRKERIMSREFNVIIEKDEEGYYIASVPELPGCHTQARSLDKLMERIREAILLYLEVEQDISTPQLVGIQRVVVNF